MWSEVRHVYFIGSLDTRHLLGLDVAVGLKAVYWVRVVVVVVVVVDEEVVYGGGWCR